MEPPDPYPELTVALRDLGAGRKEAADVLLPALVAELHAVASGYLGPRAASHTLQPTALVNETFVKLFGATGLERIHDRAHFFALAARVMRQILVDHARQRRAARRDDNGNSEVTLADTLGLGVAALADVLDVDATLDELARLDERQARIVELRFFAGLEVEEVAGVLGVSLSTVEREWRVARAWLGRRLKDRAAP
jgi:RNA polymerase sigma factor (TIGR02999 family)